jgi:enamine deaminase RidA (YjgF/YER057c/UK114 family)
MATPRAQNAARWPAYVAAGPFLFLSAQFGRSPSGGFLSAYAQLPPHTGAPRGGHDWVDRIEAPVAAQAIAIYEQYVSLLGKEGGDLRRLVRYHIYQRDKRQFPVFDRIRRSYETAPPASTALGVGRLEPTGAATLCIDGIALRQVAETMLGPRTSLNGAANHSAAAHYAHVIGSGPFLFLAGQIPVDPTKPGSPLIRNYEDIPEAGRFLSVGRSHEDSRNGPIAAQTWFTYDLIRRHLEAEGSSLECVLNLIVYLQDMRDFPTFHRVHQHFFPSNPPALTVVEARQVGHKGALIEIEPTAVVPASRTRRTIIEPTGWRAPAQMSPIVHANGLAFLSAVIGADTSGQPLTGDGDVYALQASAAVAAIQERLDAARSDLQHIVHVTVFIDDITRLGPVESTLEKAFGAHRPAFTAVEVPVPSPVAGAHLSISAIGWFGDEIALAVY